VTTARTVPVTTEMDGEELEANDAWRMAREVGLVRLLHHSFVRFRYADGFTNSRALALQAALAVVPFMLGLTGLAADIDEERPKRVIADTIDAVSPGTGEQDALGAAISGDASSQEAGEIALGFGLAFALLSMMLAMAQVERGLNRVYGIERDRRAIAKYGRAAVLTVLLAAPLGLGFMLLVAGGAFVESMRTRYGWSEQVVMWWNIGRWPFGLVLLVLAIAVLLDHAPRRRQPALSWLALGAGIAVVLTMVSTAVLAAYIHVGSSFGDVYGPLGGVFALLIWSFLCSVAILSGAAVCAQLEACRAGVPDPAQPDPGLPHSMQVSD